MDLARLADEFGISAALLAQRGLCVYEEAAILEVAEVDADGKQHLLAPATASAWRRLKADAARDGVSLVIVSAFRSVERQAEIVRRKLASGMSIDQVLSASAPPGYSEHHTGRAVDISTPGVRPLEVEFGQTPAFAWLQQHASGHGFRLSYPAGNSQGYQYEPWHWCFDDGASR
jgi:D-alanyl-D-alanine carboxypeptidase